MNSIRVASVEDISPGKGLKVKVKDFYVAIFYHNGSYYAIQNRCPHQSADLADGYLRGGQVYCPMHNWAFDIKTGAFGFNPNQRLRTYPVEIVNNEIFIMLD